MKNIKLVYVAALFLAVLAAPAFMMSRVAADPTDTNLNCLYADGEITTTEIQGCDLALTKDVSINSSAFLAADTSSSASQAKVGDTITWRITISNNSNSGYMPIGNVTVNDVLPSGVSTVSAVASIGSYTDGVWSLNVTDHLPATLTITTTALSAGTIENTASFGTYVCQEEGCRSADDPAYVDANVTNNSNNAYVTVTAVPVVENSTTPAPAAPETGFGVEHSNPAKTATVFGFVSIGLFGAAFATRQLVHKK